MPDPGHHAAAVRAQQRAVVPGLDPGQVLGPRVDPVGDAAQDRGALGDRQRGPGRERRPRRATAASTSSAPPAEISPSAVSSIGETSVKVVGGRDPLAADPVPGVDLDALDLDRAHAHPPRTTSWR